MADPASNDRHEYVSSEELQRHAAQVAAQEESLKTPKNAQKDKIKDILDKHIALHSTNRAVRERIKERGFAISARQLEIQSEASDIITSVLEKIKKELR